MAKMSIYEQLCFSTTRIETEDLQGKHSFGTGFFFNLRINDEEYPLLITNKHVVENSHKGIFKFTKKDANGDPILHDHFTMICTNQFVNSWIFHPDPAVDLCVLPINPLLQQVASRGIELFFAALDTDLIVTQIESKQMDAIEDVIMIGYPNGLWDTKNNMPIVRKGITATPPYIDYEDKKEFLIDAACFPGSSGSPILSCNIGGYRDKFGNINLGTTRITLLGILYGTYQQAITGDIQLQVVPDAYQKISAISNIPINLGCAIKAERILDFIPLINNKMTKKVTK